MLGGLGALLSVAACGGTVMGGDDGTGGTQPPPDGDIATPYDGGNGGTGGSGGWGAGGGGAPYPYGGSGGGPAGTGGDSGPETEPPPQGEAPDPFDGGVDAWPDVIDGAPPDAASPGYAPDPYDATCEVSLPDDP